MRDSVKDVVLGCAVFLIGLGALLYIQYGPGQALQTSQDAQVTFRSFPTVIAALLMALSTLFVGASLIQIFQRPGGVGTPDTRVPQARSTAVAPSVAYLFGRIVALLALLIAYAALLGKLPFFAMTSVFLFIAFLIFGQTNILRSAIVAIIGGALFHGLFVTLLKLPLY